MNWRAFGMTMVLMFVVLMLAFANLKVFGLPVNTFLICAVLFGQMYNDLVN